MDKDALLKIVERMRHTAEMVSRISPHSVCDLADELETIASPTAQPADPGLVTKCNWTEDEDGTWATACGNAWTFREGSPADNRCTFCPYCGGKIAQCSYQEPAA